ncbi:MAG: lysophospholipase [Gammaproteobacteria bacterium]|nr:lysophospholipase [Gammaproteobacteria bacterium]MCH9718051.1 lysophospholipase [Gammaproteobacteria bacterium]MCH9763627.1 lysophospholipase [Gammaproteobacteria bacterium]
MTKPFSWLWFFLACVIIGTILFYFFQRTLIYFPSKTQPSRTLFQADDMQRISLLTNDKVYLNAWYKPAAKKNPTLIIFHGNAGHIGGRMPLARYLIQRGFGVLLLEYRGYGGNRGRPTEQGFYEDARAGIRYLSQKNAPVQHLLLYGESLGTGVATKMAEEYPNVCGLILQSPYTSLTSLGQYHYPWIPITPWDKFDSLSRMKKIHVPLLILHGTEDTVIPYQEGETLFRAANQPKQWVRLQSQGHAHLWTDEFLDTIRLFTIANCSK